MYFEDTLFWGGGIFLLFIIQGQIIVILFKTNNSSHTTCILTQNPHIFIIILKHVEVILSY